MVAASHSPLLDFPARESSSVLNILAALEQARARIRAFDPELVILFGVDHYGGHHMDCMPSFCVGVEATAIADRSEEHTSELQSLMRSSSAVFCLQKKNTSKLIKN